MKTEYVDFLEKHATKPMINCHSCDNCSLYPAYGGEHLGYICSKGIDKTNPSQFFEGTDYEEISCEHYKFDGDFDMPDREKVFNIMKNIDKENIILKKHLTGLTSEVLEITSEAYESPHVQFALSLKNNSCHQ